MNVLGKIKSKKPKSQQNPLHTQNAQNQRQKPQEISQQNLILNKTPSMKFSYQNNSPKRTNNCTKPVQQAQFLMNTNVISKQKYAAIKEKESALMMTTNSISHSFSSYFQTKKQSKKSGVYFDQVPSARSNTNFSNQVFKKGQKNTNHEDTISNDDDFALDFDFLLSNKEKKQIKKNLHLSKGKAQNTRQIEEELLNQNKEVLCFYIKKWNFYGDIYMFQGELESLKKRYVEIQTEDGKLKIYDRVKMKLSCGRELIIGPQTIGRIYMSQVIFLSQNQAMIAQENLLKTVQKSRRRTKN